MRTEEAYGFVGAGPGSPAGDLAEGAAVHRRGVQPALEEGLCGVGHRRVDPGLRADRGEQGGGAHGGRVGVLAARGGRPAEAGGGVAEVAGVVDEDRAELGAGVLRLGPDRGVRCDDQGGALGVLDGLDDCGAPDGGGGVDEEGVRGEGRERGMGVVCCVAFPVV